jgi:hypothetical protein
MTKITGLTAGMLSMLALASIGMAQSNPDDTKSGTTTITGCLKPGDSGTFTISDNKGTSYIAKSTSVNLSGHSNHEVTLTGKLTPSTPDKSATSRREGSTLDVTELKMVSTTCKQ